jgi:hypothetical protein
MPEVEPLRNIRIDDEVAVLQRHDLSREVVGIARVKFVGHILIQTDDDGYYSISDGKSIGARRTSFIEPASDAHRRALQRRAS